MSYARKEDARFRICFEQLNAIIGTYTEPYKFLVLLSVLLLYCTNVEIADDFLGINGTESAVRVVVR